jgi:hypothetical protein
MNKEQILVYPEQLNIMIRTSIPGYQNIEYKPSMTIKDSNEKTVLINPLYKLNQSIINKIPNEYKIKQFFNKGLFQSLLNFNGSVPAKNLEQATRYGYVDNNIRVTLNTIFPVGSVIYIGNNPYVIGDVQWTTGDWRVEVKQKKPDIDLNKITDPRLYMQLVREEIISGEDELQQLSPTVIVGSNYSGPPVAQGIKKPPEATSTTNSTVEQPTNQIVSTPQPLVEQSKKQIMATPQPQVEQPKKQIMATPQPQVEQPRKQIMATPQPQIEQPASPQIEQSIRQPNEQLLLPQPERVEEISPEEELLYHDFKLNNPPNIRITLFLKEYFKNKIYFNLIREMFSYFPKSIQQDIRKYYMITTGDIPKKGFIGISKTSYDRLCDQMTIITSSTDGDCFFKAVIDGINSYNYENQNSKIIYLNYGKTQLFTISMLREIVLDYIQTLSDETVQNMLHISQLDVETLNNKFRIAITNLENELRARNLPVTEELYIQTLNNTYNSNDNFLIYKPTQIPININNYYSPFRILEKREIPKYIRSKDYWANNIAVEAVCKQLKLCIIPIEKYKYTSKINNQSVNRLKTLLVNNELTSQNCSKNIMFLYYSNNHYELIRFKYKNKQTIKTIGDNLGTIKQLDFKYYTIFNANDLPPPIHILFLIYGSIYSQMDIVSKNNFSIFKDVMIKMDQSTKQILTHDKAEEFIKYFDNYFPFEGKTIRNLNIQQNNELIGGAEPAKQNVANPPEKGSSKIAYLITIDMELHPGTSLTPQQISESKCNNKYNAIRKAFAEFMGKPYIIPPIYRETKNNTQKRQENKKGGRRYTRKNI